ncbi:hypothetical protein [Deinococcus hopiensis]|uniref:hypothetical protein n=1 Tax=Deinococcus hopiensis TaxID=309885 RepID=UPI00111C371A|nr:hypothetical protein [Deinococcus hopiensis]
MLYAPHPPQCCAELTLQQFARLDARFLHLPELRARGALALTVQDSADLLHAHLRLRETDGVGGEWRGTPGQLDEDPDGPTSPVLRGCGEAALASALALDLGGVQTCGVCIHELCGVLEGWPRGTVYLLSRQTVGVTVARRLNLTSFFDRLELDLLMGQDFVGYAVVRAHGLAVDGTSLVLRAGN